VTKIADLKIEGSKLRNFKNKRTKTTIKSKKYT